MKLKEKFLDHVYCFMGSGMLTNTYDEDIANWNAEKCEIIADDFAIEFSEWCQNRCVDNYENFIMPKKELLKIFKQEKGL